MGPRKRSGARIALLATAALIPLARPVAAQEATSLIGDWLGALDAGGTQLRLLFRISAADGGGVAGTLDSIDQGARGIPVTEVTLQDGMVRMSVPSVGGGFEGRLSEDGESIEGTWSQGGGSLPLTVERTDEEPAPPARPQEPTLPLPYRSEEVTFDNSEAGVTLAGTLTLPTGSGPFPAVVLVSGSGPQDRDESVFGHRPFLVLSDYLTRHGIVVLRYDDRGVGASTGDFGAATSWDFAEDALAGVAFLAGRPEVDPTAIGVVGHSEGGLVAPIAAVESDDVAFIVLMAGPGLTGEEILELQGERILLAAGAPPDLVAKNTDVQKQLFAALRESRDDVDARARMNAVFQAFFDSLDDRQLAALGVPADREAYARAQIDQLLTPWFRNFLSYDPRSTLERVQVPVLAINGEKDLQVPPRENLEAIEGALRAGGNERVTIRELPGLNHLFQPSDTGSPSEYSRIEETMAPAAMDAVSEWIRSTTGR